MKRLAISLAHRLLRWAAPQGRVCIHCVQPIGKHDKYRELMVEHRDCSMPQGPPVIALGPLPEPLGTLLDRGELL